MTACSASVFRQPHDAPPSRQLSPGQTMAVRVAVGFFAVDLAEEDMLGADAQGRRLQAGYRARIHEVMAALAIPPAVNAIP